MRLVIILFFLQFVRFSFFDTSFRCAPLGSCVLSPFCPLSPLLQPSILSVVCCAQLVTVELAFIVLVKASFVFGAVVVALSAIQVSSVAAMWWQGCGLCLRCHRVAIGVSLCLSSCAPSLAGSGQSACQSCMRICHASTSDPSTTYARSSVEHVLLYVVCSVRFHIWFNSFVKSQPNLKKSQKISNNLM